MAMKMCATTQLEERQANVEDELAGVKQKMENLVTMSRIESIFVRKTEEMMAKNKVQAPVIITNVRRACMNVLGACMDTTVNVALQRGSCKIKLDT
jgi:hypothetical protein